MSGLSFTICGAFHVFTLPRNISANTSPRKPQTRTDFGQVVDRNDADQHDWQFNQIALLPLFLGKLSFPRGEIARTMRDLLDPLTGADYEVSHLNLGVVLGVLLCPAAVKRRGYTRSGSHQDNRVLGPGSGDVEPKSQNG